MKTDKFEPADGSRINTSEDVYMLISSSITMDYGMQEDDVLFNRMFNGAARIYADYMESHKPPASTYSLESDGMFFVDKKTDKLLEEESEKVGRLAALAVSQWLYYEMEAAGRKPLYGGPMF